VRTGFSGSLEYGTYSWNPQSGALQFHVVDTTDLQNGFNGTTVLTIDVSGDSILIHPIAGLLTGHGGGRRSRTRDLGLMLSGLGAIGRAARRSAGRARAHS